MKKYFLFSLTFLSLISCSLLFANQNTYPNFPQAVIFSNATSHSLKLTATSRPPFIMEKGWETIQTLAQNTKGGKIAFEKDGQLTLTYTANDVTKPCIINLSIKNGVFAQPVLTHCTAIVTSYAPKGWGIEITKSS